MNILLQTQTKFSLISALSAIILSVFISALLLGIFTNRLETRLVGLLNQKGLITIQPQSTISGPTSIPRELELTSQVSATSVVSFFDDRLSTNLVGYGVVISGNGLVTVWENKKLETAFNNRQLSAQIGNTLYQVEAYETDPWSDWSIIKLLEANNLTPVDFGPSTELRLGETVVLAGGDTLTLATLTDTLTARLTPASKLFSHASEIISVDWRLSNSAPGVPIFGRQGRFLGFGSGENLGSPLFTAETALEEYLRTEKFSQAYLGLTVIDTALSPFTRAQPDGALVTSVTALSPAALAKIRSGDLITEINGEEISKTLTLSQILESYEAGDTITVELIRANETLVLELTLSATKK